TDRDVFPVGCRPAARIGSPSNLRAFPWHTRVVPRRNHDKSEWHSVRWLQCADSISLHGLLSYQKTTCLFASLAESAAENHRSLLKQSPDSDFSCLSGPTFFLLPWLQIPQHDFCPEPGLRRQ